MEVFVLTLAAAFLAVELQAGRHLELVAHLERDRIVDPVADPAADLVGEDGILFLGPGRSGKSVERHAYRSIQCSWIVSKSGVACNNCP